MRSPVINGQFLTFFERGNPVGVRKCCENVAKFWLFYSKRNATFQHVTCQFEIRFALEGELPW